MNEGTTDTKGPAWKRKIHFELDQEGDKFYLCNSSCATFPEKRTTNKNKVTCLNCLNKLKKEMKCVCNHLRGSHGGNGEYHCRIKGCKCNKFELRKET